MTFPDTALDLRVELFLGGVWVDITAHVYTRNPITITSGRADEGAEPDPSKATLTINNRDGRYSPRNPLSPYYGQLGRNTPIRVSVPYGSPYLGVPAPGQAAKATCPDAAPLGTAADLDVRVDIDAEEWRTGDLAAKYATGGQGSWYFGVSAGRVLTLFWTPDGTTANALQSDSTVPLPVTRGRLAVRAVLDVNNGAAGHTVTFFTAPTLAGPWAQLGAPVVTSGVTSIFDSTAPIEVGDSASSSEDAVPGRYLGFQLRVGVGAATLVANPDFSVQTPGDTSFADTASAPNTWTVNAPAVIDDRDYRFHGEVSNWPVRWRPSGADVWTSIEAQGILRRLGQGASPLNSALVRDITALTTPYLEWWPLEVGGGEFTPSAIMGRAAMRVLGEVAFGEEGAPAGASGAATFEGRLQGTEDLAGELYTSADTPTGDWVVGCWIDTPSVADLGGAGSDGTSPWICIQVPGTTIRQWTMRMEADLSATQHRVVVGRTNADTSGTDFSQDRDLTGLHYFVLHSKQNGGDWQIVLYVDGAEMYTVTVAGQTALPVNALSVNQTFTGVIGASIKGSVSHIIIADGTRLADVLSHHQAGTGYDGEPAGRRFERLCGEEGVPFAYLGDLDATEPMGPQRPERFLDLLAECADADMGTLYEPRNALALGYRTRESAYNQAPALTLGYATTLAAPLEPVDDDQNTRNDVEAKREGGSSARAVLEAGPLSIQAPPDGVGRYDESATVNVADDTQLPDQAGWRLHLGTVDEARFPAVRVKLHKHPTLIGDVAGMQPRSLIRLTDLPAWLPPEDADLLAEGYTEVLEPLRWWIEFNTAPGSPYRVAVLDDEVLGRLDTAGSGLASAVDADDTTLLVATTDGPPWTTTPAEFPLDVRVGGEVATLTAATDGVTDLFDRTVANGWGTAPDGQTWTVTGTASNYAVTGGEGRITFTATNLARAAALSQHCAAVDVEVAFKLPVAAFTGSAAFLYLIGSYDQVGNDWYALVVILNTSGVMSVFFERKTAGVTTALNGATDVPGVTVSSTATYRARLQIQEGILLGKLWNAASPEPQWWHTIHHDSTHLDGGDVGVQVFLPAGVTNPLPLTFAFPELIVHNPQKLTATRSVNGVAKPHPAGTDVRLANPTILAL